MNNNFVNRICPKCGNPNYVISLEGRSVLFKYKCTNCYTYFNGDEDMKSVKVYEPDRVNVVRCKDCKFYRPNNSAVGCLKVVRGENADDEWFCADGVRLE